MENRSARPPAQAGIWRRGVVPAFLLLTSVAGADDFFAAKIEPLLKARCFECHSHEKKIKGGLALDSRSGWEKGGESGPAIVPGKPGESLLIQAVSHLEKDLKMPPKKMLPEAEIALLTEWVRQGAPDPRASVSKPVEADLAADGSWETEFQKRLDWWSLKPMSRAEPPAVQDAAWSREPVDRFVRATLETAALRPAPAAGPEVLLRRLSFVLTGLPPTPEDVKTFAQSAEESAYERLVDHLLQSPHFGERFARHWMDVVRYTDTYGYEWDNPAKGSWEFRDYLIRAFNDDLGFDQLLREQLAGDLLPSPRVHAAFGTNESLIGPMFYHLGEHRHGSSLMFNGIHQDMVNNKIDAFSKAFLATSVACARCHDHKLEAVSQRDYYALAAVFTTPRWTSRVVDAPGRNDVAIARLKELREAIRRELSVLWIDAPVAPAALKAACGDVAKVNPEMQDVAYPLIRMIRRETDAVAAWTELKDEWQKARDQRRKANSAFHTLADFHDESLPPAWVIEGDGMKHGFVSDGTPLIALTGDAVISRLLPQGCHTHALSSKLAGSLRMPPEHVVPGKLVSVNIAGGEFGGYLVVDDHAFQNETVTFLTNAEPQWKSFADAALKNGVQQVTVEFATSSLNPNFPPRTGLAKGLANNDPGYDKRSWLSITGIVSHDSGGAPQDELGAFAGLYGGDAPKTGDEAWKRVTDWFGDAVKRWRDGQARAGDRILIDWLLGKGLLPNKAAAGSRLAALLADYREVESRIAFPRTANSMDERETARAGYPLNVRGNVDVPGGLVQPDFLRMFEGRNDVARSEGSGRLELARSLLDPEHPLTSRVYVNRVWHWIFGAGLVATPDDFGRLGAKPSHPELLDYLAREFVREGWSTKKLVRRLVLSQTFRQSGAVSDAARERDPGNRLLHHYPTRRLEAEAIRDALLAVAGRLDPHLYGKPIDPPRAAEDGAKRLFSGPLDGDGRRSIYLKMSIMEPPKFLAGFNLPDLRLPTGKRDVTNVPAQALLLLNDPLVTSLAKHWAARMLKMPHSSPEERITTMFMEALGRAPDAVELPRWSAALRDFAASGGGNLMKDEPAWTQLAHVIFNTKEFIHYR
jgi:hypothetical protein